MCSCKSGGAILVQSVWFARADSFRDSNAGPSLAVVQALDFEGNLHTWHLHYHHNVNGTTHPEVVRSCMLNTSRT